METRTSHRSYETTLLTLPVEVLDRIGSLLEGDAFCNLVLVGNRALDRKMRQFRTVNVLWRSSSFCDWRRCLPFVNSFPGLKSLALHSESPIRLLEQGFVMAVLPSILPPTLQSLSLRCHSALSVLKDESAFYRHPSLTSLTIADESELRANERTQRIFISRLPPALKSLSLSGGPKSPYHMVPDDFQRLPSELVLCDVSIPIQTFAYVSVGFPPHSTSLTHLSLDTNSYLSVDLGRVASTLQTLELYCGSIKVAGNSFLSLFSLRGDPVRSLLPRLHTLQLPRTYRLSLRVFATLPTSLTSLSATFDWLELSHSENIRMLTKLNLDYDTLAGDGRPCAPKMLRYLWTPQEYSLDYLSFFSGITTFDVSSSSRLYSTDALLPRITSLKVQHLNGAVEHLPRSLTSISCKSFVITPSQPQVPSSPSPHQGFPALTYLQISESRMTPAIVDLLPDTLEHLEALFLTNEAMEALAARANDQKRLNRLTSLFLRVPNAEAQDGEKAVLVSLNTIPTSIKTLTIRGICQFGTQTSSLSQHPNLTRITFEQFPRHSKVVFSHLPKQLLYLTATLSDPLDPSDPEMIRLLLNLPPQLHELRLKMRECETRRWVLPATKSSLRQLRPEMFRSGKWLRFELLRCISNSPGYNLALSETFVLSCLPKTLTVLSAPLLTLNQLSSVLLATDIPTYLGANLGNIAKYLLVARLPLLGLFVKSQFRPSQEFFHDALTYNDVERSRIPYLPPRLSLLESPHGPVSTQHTPGDPPLSRWNSLLFKVRAGVHAVNLLNWLQMLYWLSIDRNEHPIAWTYQWINILGSAVAIPLNLNFARRLPSYPDADLTLRPTTRTLLLIPVLFVLPATIAFFMSTYGTAMILGYTPSRWSTVSRILAGIGVYAAEGIMFLLGRKIFL